ncbi:hypothetical protein EK21DRAFT_106370 [Setomelanomma holmii]|uniref:Uncharacterized protein n=1 Tax=Setomelanomma holmii TaxID=210430 RepID=A0A9P4HJ78_9PLEO|nr:hypothetical protein EK21DRAFT_106370 [Setomelanomma holmii]
MKLNQVALTGLRLVGLAIGAPSGPTEVTHLNDGDYRYHCEALDIYKCGVLGSCSLYEDCKTWCIDLTAPGGARCADAPPKAVEARAEKTTTSDLGTQYKNDDDFKFYCVDDNVNQCHARIKLPCIIIDHCANGCMTLDDGVSCLESPAVTARDEFEAGFVSTAQSKCDGQPDGCKMCTGTRRGVLTCIGSFCAVKPGDWCSKDTSCHDDCDCCEKGRKRAVMTAKSLESAPQVKRSTNDVAVPPATPPAVGVDKCKPGDYWCYPYDYSWLIICDANGVWQWSAYCGKNGIYGCCQGSKDPSPDHRCDCRPPSSRQLIADVDIKRATDEVTVAETAQECSPGQFWCDQTNFDWIIVCGQNGKWQISSYCGKTSQGYGCCRGSSIPGGSPSCDCRSLPGGPPTHLRDAQHIDPVTAESTTDANVAQNLESTAVSTPEARSTDDGNDDRGVPRAETPQEGECTPGTYRCRQPFIYGQIQLCDSQGVWYISAVCCGPYTCYDPPGDEPPRCECGPSSHGNDVASSPRFIAARQFDPEAGPQDPDEPELCSPGRYTCGDRNRKV